MHTAQYIIKKTVNGRCREKYRIIRGLDEEHVKLSDGMINGDYHRYRDGVLRESGIYVKGKRNGTFTEYYQDGVTPRKETPILQGKIDGTVKTYFRNGKIEIEKGVQTECGGTGNVALPTRRVSRFLNLIISTGKRWRGMGKSSRTGRAIRSKTTCHYRNGKPDGSYRVESTWEGKPYITIEGQYTDGEKSGQWIQHNYQDNTQTCTWHGEGGA